MNVKNFILSFSFLFVTNLALASNIDYTTHNTIFSQWPSLLKSQVTWAQDEIDPYLEQTLGCDISRLYLKINQEPGYFHKGSFDLTLKAQCKADFSDFKFIFSPGYDEYYTMMTISLTLNGKPVTKTFKTNDF